MSQSRREFLRTTSLAGAAAFAAGSSNLPGLTRRSRQRSTPQEVRAVRTPVLEIAFEESGRAGGFPIILLHGFPYDVRAWDGVTPPLVQAGYRVLAPYLRGYGPTRFVDETEPRRAEQAAIAQDVIDFADAMGLESFALAGFDWGNRAGCIAAIVRPDRVRAQVAIGGYSVQDTVAPSRPAPPEAEARLWYQWYFNTERGRAGLEANRAAICRYLWETWSPGWDFTDETFARTARSFDNPDFVDVVIHSYRHRHGNARGDDRFLELERRLAERPPVEIPAIVLHGRDSGFGLPSPDPTGDQARFTSLVARRIVAGAGHYLPAQAPDAVSSALIELLSA